MSNSINAITIKTEDDLDVLLSSMGYKTCHYDRMDLTIIRKVTKKFTNEPCRSITAQDNNLESHVLVIVEDNEFCVYYYDFPNDLFRFWGNLSGDVSPATLQELIKAATTEEEILKKLGYR
jgi:hypothetical protein